MTLSSPLSSSVTHFLFHSRLNTYIFSLNPSCHRNVVFSSGSSCICSLWPIDSHAIRDRGPIDLWTFRPLIVSPPRRFAPCLDVSPPGRFALWTIRPLHVDVSLPGRFAPWTFRPIHVDVSPPELSFVGVSRARSGRTDGRSLRMFSQVVTALLGYT